MGLSLSIRAERLVKGSIALDDKKRVAFIGYTKIFIVFVSDGQCKRYTRKRT